MSLEEKLRKIEDATKTNYIAMDICVLVLCLGIVLAVLAVTI